MIASAHLDTSLYKAHPAGHHGWLTLPPGWVASTFVSHLRGNDIVLVDQGTFAIGGTSDDAPGVRVSLGSVPDRADLLTVLKALNEALELEPTRTLHYG